MTEKRLYASPEWRLRYLDYVASVQMGAEAVLVNVKLDRRVAVQRRAFAPPEWSFAPSGDRGHPQRSAGRRGGGNARPPDCRPARCAGETTCRHNRKPASSPAPPVCPPIAPGEEPRPECHKHS